MLKSGDSGVEVKALQQRLTEWGFPVAADGVYSSKTVAAVKGFQKAMGLYIDGIAGTKTLGALSGSIIRVTHFKKEEFKCHCDKYCNGYPDASDKYGGIDYSLLILLERMRSAAGGVPCHITSGYRCRKYNAKVGGAANSQHIYGKAADIYFDGLSVPWVNKIADRINPYGGVSLNGGTITHVDTRGYRARWSYGD